MSKNTTSLKRDIPRINNDFSFFENDKLNLAILFVFWFILLRELITGNAWLFDDFPYVYYPGKFLSAVSLSNGIFPFWNPYSFSGTPFFADPQIAVLYPFNFLMKYFVSGESLSPLIIQNFLLIHYFLCSVFCYYLAKEFKLNKFASLVFALTFTYSAYMVIHMIHYNLIETVAWLPLIFLLIIKFYNSGNFLFIIFAGIIMSFSILAGYPQCFFYNFVFLLVYSFYVLYKDFQIKNFKNVTRIISGLAIFFIISVGISTVQLLPTYIFSQNSDRADVGYDFIKQGSVHIYDLITLLAPKIFGTFNWNDAAREQSYWSVIKNGGHQEGPWMYTVSTLYLTILPLLILIPVLRYSFKSKQKIFPVTFFLIFSILIFMFALGGNFFLHKLFFLFVPVFDKFRNPGHILYLFSICLLMISAFGLSEIIKNKNALKNYFTKTYFYILAGIIFLIFILTNSGFFSSLSTAFKSPEIYSWVTGQLNVFFFLAIAFTAVIYFYFQDKLSLKGFSISLFILICIDIYVFAFNQNNGDKDPLTFYSQNANVINQLKEEGKKEEFRTNMREGGNMMFQRYQGAVDKIQLIEGVNVLRLNRISPFSKTSDPSGKQTFDLLNVKYRINVDKNKKSMSLAKQEKYLPRAKMFYDVKVIENPAELKKYMESDEFDYYKTIVLEKDPGNISLPLNSKSDSAFSASDKIEITKYDLNNINLNVENSENGFLFLSEVFYPDWKAFVDGKEVEIFRTDYSLRSVYLEKGNHKVEFVYSSKEFDLGSKVSLSVLFLSFAGIGFIFFRQRRSVKSNE
ncbi:MAG TPA: YfhO family protein [Ignavibacteria bacterium]|nr:YfhO family protein [Ignavibacteria bacterium]